MTMRTRRSSFEQKPDPSEIVLRPHRGAHGLTYWEAEEESRDEVTLTGALLRLVGQLLLFFLQIIWYLVKWALVIALYAAIFGFFLLLFAVLFSL